MGKGLGDIPKIDFGDISDQEVRSELQDLEHDKPPLPPPPEGDDSEESSRTRRQRRTKESSRREAIKEAGASSLPDAPVLAPRLAGKDADVSVPAHVDEVNEVGEEHKKKRSWFDVFHPVSLPSINLPHIPIPFLHLDHKADDDAPLPPSPQSKRPVFSPASPKQETNIQAPVSKSPEHPQSQEHVRRYAQYVDNLKRRLDMEVRERHAHAAQIEKELEERQKKIDAMEDSILKKEIALLGKERDHGKVRRLQEDLENKQITLNYQKEEMDRMRKELDDRAREIKRMERELDERAMRVQDRLHQEAVEYLDGENEKAHQLIDLEDDAINYLSDIDEDLERLLAQKELQDDEQHVSVAREDHAAGDALSISPKEALVDSKSDDASLFPEEQQYDANLFEQDIFEQGQGGDARQETRADSGVAIHDVSKAGEDVVALSPHDAVASSLNKAYGALEKQDFAQARKLYEAARQEYNRLRIESGDDPSLHHQILELYDDIRLNELI